MFDMVTIGDIKHDTFILLPEANVMCELKMPECQLCLSYGEKIPVDDIESQVAGSAPNVAIALAKMDQSSSVYSEMGKDIMHKIAKEFLQENDVDTEHVHAIEGKDSSFAAVLNFKGESTQLVSHGDRQYTIKDDFPETQWVHVSELGGGYEKLYADLIKLIKEKNVKISLNPGTVQLQERKDELFELIKHTTVLFLNKVEALQILQAAEKTEIHRLMADLLQLGPDYVVVTDGRNGANAFDGKQLDFVPMFPGERVEATGAGDSFASGFLGAIMLGEGHGEALKWGSVNAASVVGEIGPTKGLMSHTEIKKQLKDNPDYKRKEL